MSESTNELIERLAKATRKLKAPSERNQQIAAEVRVLGRTQTAVAAEHKLSQRRISQICRQVERWEAQTPRDERYELSDDDRSRVERSLHEQQLGEIYRRAMQAYEQSTRPLSTKRSGTRADGQSWSEEIEREQRLDLQSLRLAQRAIEMQWKLADRRKPYDYTSSEAHDVSNMRRLVQGLTVLRCHAESHAGMPSNSASRDAAVERCLRDLLQPGVPASPPSSEPTSTASSQPASRPAYSSPSGASAAEGHRSSGITERTSDVTHAAVARYGQSAAGSKVPERGLAGGQKIDARIGSSDRPDATGTRLGPPVEPGSAPDRPSLDARPLPAAEDRQPRPAEEYREQLARERQRVQANLEYHFGLRMDGERIAAELKQLQRERLGRFTMFVLSRGQRAALIEWEKLHHSDVFHSYS